MPNLVEKIILWIPPHLVIWVILRSPPGRSVTGRLDLDRRDAYGVEHHADRSVSTRHPRKRQRSDSSYSEHDDADIEIQDLRSQLARESRRNQDLKAMAERAEHHRHQRSHNL
eukprot:3962657-Amphidinium_carterae.2